MFDKVTPLSSTKDNIQLIRWMDSTCYQDPWSSEKIELFLRHPNAKVVHFKKIGYCIYSTTNDMINCYRLAVLPRYREQGIGTMMLNHVLKKMNVQQSVTCISNNLGNTAGLNWLNHKLKDCNTRFIYDNGHVLCMCLAFRPVQLDDMEERMVYWVRDPECKLASRCRLLSIDYSKTPVELLFRLLDESDEHILGGPCEVYEFRRLSVA